MSLGDYLNSTIGTPGPDVREVQDVAEIHKRLDSISRQVEHISRAPTGTKSDPGVARQLNDAISRLDARLSQISEKGTMPSAAAGPAYPSTPSPSIAASAMPPMDFSIAEIVARQGELDGAPRSRTAMNMPAPTFAAPAQPQMQHADFSGMERQLSHMTHQIETLRRPDAVIEQSIASFRGELADIRHAITEALPRRAIESLESEIRSLGKRIDETRSNGSDAAALSGVERALSEIRGELRSLTPAEHLAGFDEAIRNLGGKIDTIVRTSPDPSTIRQLEDAIAALKIIVSNIASNDALTQLTDHVQTLSSKVDQLADRSGGGEILSALEQRIAILTSALETRDRPSGDSSYFDNAVRTISDRLDHLQVGSDSASSFNHVEQRVHHLLERLENSDNRGGNLARVEEGLSDILRHLEQQRTGGALPMDGGLVDTIKRELTDMRYSQSEKDRHTQDSLEVVHSTLGHVVDRLAQIEGDIRNVRNNAPVSRAPAPQPIEEPRAREIFAPEPPRAQQPGAMLRPELPNPAAAAQIQKPRPPVAAQHREPAPAAPSMADIAISGQHIQIAAPAAARPATAARNHPIDPNLPPDHPLEPGTRPQQGRAISTPSERIAASESALGEISLQAREPVSSSNFIQAARRAAQAAAAAPAPSPSAPKPNRVTSLNDSTRSAAKVSATGNSSVSSKIRALLVGASVVVIVLGTVKMGMNLLGSRDSASAPSAESSDAAPVTSPSGRENEPRSDNSDSATPSMTSPTPIDRQSMSTPQTIAPMQGVKTASRPPATELPSADITGSVSAPAERISVTIPPVAARKPKVNLVPVNDRIPDAIGGPALRAAAAKGDAGAAFEIGLRYAEGRGVAVNYEEAAKWYERAANGGIVPASFRLGTLHEKGLGTKKDIEAARRHYLQAAEHGSAKAMHNLAVLDADGGGSGPNYRGAVQWFRKAAERGIADSQFNLAILYARGIGVEQNLAESFKWFSLAAAQGDADAGRKRDDVAKRLDPQSLAAAKLAIQTFIPEAQPDEAISAGAPAGGWDAATAPAKTSAKPPTAPAKTAAAKSAVR
jgi:localization factor PodJL